MSACIPPAKSATELADRTAKRANAAWTEANEKYQISEKTSAAATATKNGIISLWGRAKTLVEKKPPANASNASGTATENDKGNDPA